MSTVMDHTAHLAELLRVRTGAEIVHLARPTLVGTCPALTLCGRGIKPEAVVTGRETLPTCNRCWDLLAEAVPA